MLAIIRVDHGESSVQSVGGLRRVPASFVAAIGLELTEFRSAVLAIRGRDTVAIVRGARDFHDQGAIMRVGIEELLVLVSIAALQFGRGDGRGVTFFADR